MEKADRTRHAARGALDRDELAALVAADLTIREIGERVDRSRTTVRHWLRRYDLHTTRAARAKEPRDQPPATRFEGVCSKHGPGTFVTRRSGGATCIRCRSDAVTRRRRKVKRILVEEAGGACAICGYDRCVGALQFHHLDPASKRFELSLMGVARALDDLREEAQKCVVLCANCHAEVEGGLTQVPARSSSEHHLRG